MKLPPSTSPKTLLKTFINKIMSEEISKIYAASGFNMLVATIGLIGSILVAYLTSYFTSKNETKKLHHKTAENLHEKRFETYTPLLEITQDIGKNIKDVDLNKGARKKLKEWQMKSGGYLLFSQKTLNEFNKLKSALKPEPQETKKYSQEQRKKIWQARNAFRGALRDEFDFINNGK
jgi:hypothetical protein